MKTGLLLAIILVSGFSAGLIHGALNLILVEPYLDSAIDIENQNLFSSGEEKDTPEFWADFREYRQWQKSGQVLAGGILGLSFGALFGVVFVYSIGRLPGNHYAKKALILAGIMWLTLFLIPAIKYPANPPTVGDGDTILLRQSLYIAFIAFSGLGALGFSVIYKKMKNKARVYIIPIAFAVYITIGFVLMPSNPDEVTAPMDLVNNFRIISGLTVTIFWIVNALILGFLWQKFRPDEDIVKQVNS